MGKSDDLETVLRDLLDVRRVIDDLRDDLIATLGDELLALYLYGSAVWGDFDPDISDLDMTAVVSQTIVEADLPTLEAMHAAFVERHPTWNDRIEVQYITPDALLTFREQPGTMANISPGEPLHIIESNIDWLTNWYFIQDYGVALYGPPASTYIPPISDAEFQRAIYDHAMGWLYYVEHTRASVPYQGYAVLTLARAQFTMATGKQVSKRKAAEWVMERYPEDTDLVRRALQWRTEHRTPQENPAETYPLVENYVKTSVARIAKLMHN